jgi:signal transduction histidine kinase
VHRAVEATEDVVEDRGHRLEIALPTTDVYAEADGARLEQVVVNLLTNAAKYTEPGGRIIVSVTREGAEAVLRVRDTGVGIAPEALPHVFELFAQGERTSTARRAVSGSVSRSCGGSSSCTAGAWKRTAKG